jgi:tetraacyldisaccharide 4'-kinase
MEARLVDVWYGDRRRATPLLRSLSWLYGGVTALRSKAYRARWLSSYRVGKPVVVVGNLTVGGTGKTPLVAWLARRLTERGIKVGLVSRGYGRSYDAPHLVQEDSSWRDVGDEPLLLRRHTGCLTVVGRDRVAAAQSLVAHGVDAIIADDGLQHLRLARDCEIVVVDGARGFGNGRLLPAGPLRERTSAVRNADLVVINGPPQHGSLAATGLVDGSGEPGAASPRTVLMTVAASAARRVDGGSEARPLDVFRKSRAHAVAGIGNPGRFFRELRERGIDIIEHAFPDHHPFTAQELDFQDGLPVLMTEKDAVKCREFAKRQFWYVPVAAQFSKVHERAVLHCVLSRMGLAS